MNADPAMAEIIRTTPDTGIGGRVFLGLVPDSQPLPAVSYFRISHSQTEAAISGSRLMGTDYQVRVVGSNATESATIADTLEMVFHDYRGVIAGIKVLGSEMTDRAPDWTTAPGYHAELLKVTIYTKG